MQLIASERKLNYPRYSIDYSKNKCFLYIVSGKNDFKSELLKYLKYPQKAKNWGVEGTVYARFVVDSNGEISNIYVTENIESSMDRYVNDLKESTKEAVMETSGSWKPAEVNGTNVSSLFVLPLTFTIERHPSIPMMI